MLPPLIHTRLEEMMRQQLLEGGATADDFLLPEGEPSLVAPDSISWSVFSNPVSLMIGGIAAVILELAEPKIRSGVWDHTTFRTDPLRRMRRTGAAAMITVYAAESRAKRMIEGVRRAHDKVTGHTPDGVPYHANDPDLLRWVHSTAAFGFLEAYHRYVRPLSQFQRDAYFTEGGPIAKLYGAKLAPSSEAEWDAMVDEMLPRLEPSEVLSEFLEIMRRLTLMPGPIRSLNHVLVRCAIDILPDTVRQKLNLAKISGFPGERILLRSAARSAELLDLASSPRSQARVRMGIRTA